MADATNIKNLVVSIGESVYQISGGEDICGELGISKERFAELLARDFYCPVLQSEPTSSTLTYTDTDGSVNHFAIGQECRVPDVESQDYRVYKFMGTYQGDAVWQKLPDKLSDLENDMSLYSGANVQAVDSSKTLDQPEVIYLTTKPQVLTEEEKATVRDNLGISIDDMDLSAYATKEELAGYATKKDISGFITGEDIKDLATKGELTGLATKEELDEFVKEDALSGLATKSELEGYVTDQELANYATKEEVAGFVTESDLAGYATKEELENITGVTPLVDHGTDDSVYALTPNVYHKWGEMGSLELTLAAPADPNIYNEYMFEFRSGDTATTLTLPDSVDWISAPSISPNTVSQCSIVNNVGIIVTVNI